jgi:glycosyltransferase involved in cell wall biosynthesis
LSERLKIAISLLSASSYGGVTYVNGLLPALAEIDERNEYHIYVAKNSPFAALVSQGNFFFHECLQDNESALKRLLWEQFTLPKVLRNMNIDVMFTAKNVDIFAASCKTVISIRNVEPLFYAQHRNNWRLNIVSWLRRLLTRLSVRTSDRIIAVSQSSRNHLENFSSKAVGKVDVVYNGNSLEKNSQPMEPSKRTPKFILTASKFVAYANQAGLIDGYALLIRRKPDTPPLWIAGGVHDKDYFQRVKKLIQAYGIEDKVKILGLVPHRRLIELYSHASAFLFPSTLEACPQTLVEAMACGAAIAASNVPPMPEICEDAAIYFEPFDPADIAEKIDRLLSDQTLRNTLTQRAVVRSGLFSWTESARQIVNILEKVANCNSSIVESPITSKL